MVKIKNFLPLFSLNHFSSAQTSIEIDYNHTPGAFEILSHFINDPNWIELLLEHGCWCAKLDPDTPPLLLGGPTTVDELDLICKQWAQARSCTRLAGKSCENLTRQDLILSPMHYEVDYVYGINDAICPDSDVCLSETCQIDVFYVKALMEWKNNNEGQLTPVTSPVCGMGKGGSGAHNYCDGVTTTEKVEKYRKM